MASKPSAIPVGTQFSPALIDLREFLAACIRSSGNKEGLADATWKAPVWLKPIGKRPTKRRRSLPLEAAVQYRLLEPRTYEATTLTKQLALLSQADLDTQFARHILLNLGGLRVVEGAQQMRLDGLKVNSDSLAEYLTEQGFTVAVHNTAINTLRMWLSRAGVFIGSGWEVDPLRKAEVAGLDEPLIEALVGLDRPQQAFVLALCRLDPSGKYPAAEVRNMASFILGKNLGKESIPNRFLKPLKLAGLIDYETRGTAGGKTSLLWTTSRFRSDVLEPFITETTKTLDSLLTTYYHKPPTEIYAELDGSDTGARGRALEAYAVHIMRQMGLRFVGWRKRPKEAGGAELDVLMSGIVAGLPSLWQIQCKNTPKGSVDIEDVAKEVGLAEVTKASHIMIIANCRFTDAAIAFALEVMRETPLVIFLLDERDFSRIKKSPGDLPLILRAKSEVAMQIHSQSVWLP